jgi:hypothetical protein
MEQSLQTALEAGREQAEDCRQQQDEKRGLPHTDSFALREAKTLLAADERR